MTAPTTTQTGGTNDTGSTSDAGSGTSKGGDVPVVPG